VSKFVKSTKYTTEFDGDQVTVMLRPLSLPDGLEMERLANPSSDPDLLFTRLQDIVPRYVESIEGLRDAGGNLLTITDVASHRYFMTLLGDLGLALLKAAMNVDPSQPAAASAGLSAGSLSPTNGD